MKRMVSLLLVASIIFSNVTFAEETVPQRDEYHRVNVCYESVKGQSVIDEEFWYSDTAFEKPAHEENPILAIASSYMAAAAYQQVYMEDVLNNLGFEILFSEYPSSGTVRDDLIAYTIARKHINRYGIGYDLYAVCVRGTAKNMEWGLNFDVGLNQNEHKGFADAKDRILRTLKQYITTPEGTNIIWTMGHSRGAAVSNLLAATLQEESLLVHPQNVYCYTYATPKVTKTPKASQTIYNYVNDADFVTRIPLSQWGFYRNGVDISLPNSGKIEKGMKKYFKAINSDGYLGFSKTQTDLVVRTTESYAPTLKDYYGTRFDLGGWHSPFSFFANGVAPVLMGQVDSLAAQILVDELAASSLAFTIAVELLGTEILSFAKGILSSDPPTEFNIYPFAHAHSKESYIGYMHSMYDAAAEQMIKKETGESGVLGFIKDLFGDQTGTLVSNDTADSSANQKPVVEWTLSDENLHQRLTESIDLYNATYATSLEYLNYTTGTYGDGTRYSLYTSKSGTVELFICHRANGYLSIDGDCVLSFFGGERKDGSFLHHPDFPYCYIIASCFADGQNFQERLSNIQSSLNLNELAPKTRLDWNSFEESEEWIDYPFYNGTNYCMADWPNTAPFQLVIYSNKNAQDDIVSSEKNSALINPFVSSSKTFNIEGFVNNYRLTLAEYNRKYGLNLDEWDYGFASLKIDAGKTLDHSIYHGWPEMGLSFGTNDKNELSQLQISLWGFDWAYSSPQEQPLYHQLMVLASSFLYHLDVSEAVELIHQEFGNLKPNIKEVWEANGISADYSLSLPTGYKLKLSFSCFEGLAVFLTLEFPDEDIQVTTFEEKEIVNHDPVVVVSLNAFMPNDTTVSGYALSQSGAPVTEVGMYWGAEQNQMELLGSDNTVTLASPYVDFFYSFSFPRSNSFLYQAYAVVNGEYYWSDIKEAKVNTSSSEKAQEQEQQIQYSYTQEQLETLEFVKNHPENAMHFFGVTYHLDALNNKLDLGDTIQMALAIGHDLLKSWLVDQAQNSNVQSYMVEEYRSELMALIKSIAPDSYEVETASYGQLIADSVEMYGKVNMDYIMSMLPKDQKTWSEATKSGMKVLGRTVNSLEMFTKVPGAIDELATIAGIAFADYEKGMAMLEALTNSMIDTGNEEFEAAVDELYRSYSSRLEAYSIAFFKELKKQISDEAVDGIIEWGISTFSSAYSVGAFVYDLWNEVSGNKKLGESKMQFIAQTEVFGYCRLAYYDAFMRVYNGDYSPKAIDELIMLYKLTLSSADRLYISLYNMSSSGDKAEALYQKNIQVNSLFGCGPVYFLPDNDY